MKNRYEGLLVLNTKGTEDSAKEIIDRLEGEFKKEGAKIEQVQKMDKRPFSYAAGHLDALDIKPAESSAAYHTHSW